MPRVYKERTCEKCKETFKKSSFYTHLSSCNDGRNIEKVNCSFCSLSVLPKNLKNHQKVCLQNPEKEEPSIKCALCEKSFSSNSNLKRHKTIQHDKDSEYDEKHLLAPSIVKPQSCYPSTSSANATTQNLTDSPLHHLLSPSLVTPKTNSVPTSSSDYHLETINSSQTCDQHLQVKRKLFEETLTAKVR